MARRASIGHKALSLVLVAALGSEGQALAAMAPGTATASTPASGEASASDLSAQAIERFQAKDYDAAVRLFDEAYKLDPKTPNYLFNIGRVYEEKGDIRAAVDYYQRFVKEPGVELEARELALQRLRVLKAILQETDGKEPDEVEKPAPPPEGPKSEGPKPEGPKPADGSGRKLTVAGAALLGVGGVAMAVGGILGGVTLSKQNQLDATHDYDTRVDLARQGRGLAAGTDVLLAVGGAMVVTGIVLVAVSAAKRRKAVASRPAVWPAGFGLAGRF